MSEIHPAMFRWMKAEVVDEATGESRRAKVMVPHPRFAQLCDRQYVEDEDYALIPFERRSTASHNHLFASIKNTWDNLPVEWTVKFPSPEHLRKWLLVQAGHASHSQFVMDTPKDAMLFARGLRRFDEYAVIKVSGNAVDVWTAKSISRQSVPTKEEFQDVKNRLLDGLAVISGNTRSEIEDEGRQKMLPPARKAAFDGGER